jgi:hypothetical protein
MTKDDVLTILRAGTATIEFVKVDGSVRNMNATLNESRIAYTRPIEGSSTTRKIPEHTCSVWDLDDNAWKSFRWENLRVVNGVVLENVIT